MLCQGRPEELWGFVKGTFWGLGRTVGADDWAGLFLEKASPCLRIVDSALS